MFPNPGRLAISPAGTASAAKLVSAELSEAQLDALSELANIGAGTAATALSQMLAQEVTLSVPRALALPLADAVAAAGPAEQIVTGVVIPLQGDLEAIVVLLISSEDAQTLCSLLGVEAGTEVGESALSEIGNILGASYMSALSGMTGLSLELCPPQLLTDLRASIVASLLALTAGDGDTALMLDTALDLAAHPCALSFLLIPIGGSVTTLLAPLGLAEAAQ
ncbi:MAG: chemotaxis protein CheC [Solirubrobacteraceae bacterium]